MKQYKTLVYIGRFSPFHNGHLETIRLAQQLCEQLIIIVGSSHGPRTAKNPWTFDERVTFITEALTQDFLHGPLKGEARFGTKFEYEPAVDYLYNDDRWAKQIQDIVAKYNDDDSTIGIIGHEKDSSSFYLKMFPQWQKHLINATKHNDYVINGTDIRYLFFSGMIEKCSDYLPYIVFMNLYSNYDRKWVKDIQTEQLFINEYKQKFSSLPYPPIFVTTDAIVIQSGHILMVKRNSFPGKGLWALPGGFVNAETDRSLIDAMIRELKEETKLKVPDPVLRGSIINSRVFDAIGRSARGRTITHAYHIKLPDGELPKVKGSDDAEKAKFVPLNEIERSKCFEDHYEIISYFTGI